MNRCEYRDFLPIISSTPATTRLVLWLPQSVDDIAFYADWVGEQWTEMTNGNLRFKITHAQLLMPNNTINVVHGKVLVMNEVGEEYVLHNLNLKMVYTIDGWVVDYVSPLSMW